MHTKIGFVARDKNGNLYFYESVPKRNRHQGIWVTNDPMEKFSELPKQWFSEVQWSSEPLLIEITFNVA